MDTEAYSRDYPCAIAPAAVYRKRDAVLEAIEFLCVCDLLSPPLRECGDGSLKLKAGLGSSLDCCRNQTETKLRRDVRSCLRLT